MVTAGSSWRGLVAGEKEDVIALVESEMEALRDRRHHLLRRLRASLPLQARVVVDRHVAQSRNLLAPKPVGTSALPAGNADVLRLQRLAALPKELCQSDAIDHAAILAQARTR